MTIRAAHRKFVVAPSPLAGEGNSDFPQRKLGEGVDSPELSYEATPSPTHTLLLYLHALSREGRGRSNTHPLIGRSSSRGTP
jgi:hypothetical protein